MATKQGGLLAEMAAIVSLAVVIGLAWNHTLIYNAWSGKAVKTAPKAANSAGPANQLPLIAGLMQVKDFHDRNEALFIDARDRVTYAGGHIKGAIPLPIGEVDKEIPRLLQQTPVTTVLVVYCNGYDCHDSTTLAERLLKAGYRTVFVFQGGYPEWQDAGYPVARGGR